MSTAASASGAFHEPAMIAQLREQFRRQPDNAALRHKVRGAWYVWRWSDVALEVWLLTAGLAARGFGRGSTLAVSGDIRPHLLLLTLAVRSLGGSVIAVPRHAGESDVARLLEGGTSRHVFLHGREPLALWLAVAERLGVDLAVISDHVNPSDQAVHPNSLSYSALREAAVKPPETQALDAAPLARPALVWAEESTDWTEGVDILIGHWLAEGFTLAFPESAAAAERDRRETRPERAILSARRVVELHDEILARLPPAGSLQRSLAEWALGLIGPRGRSLAGGAIVALLRRALGFGRLAEILVVSGGASGPELLPASVKRLFDGLGADLLASDRAARPAAPAGLQALPAA
jgi:hypothetical protein